MNSSTAVGLDSEYDRSQWAGVGYLMEELGDDSGGLPHSDMVYDNEAMWWMGDLYRYWHFYTGESSKEIGRPDARPHDLRHTAATVAIASGADIKSVQELMGRATSSFTLDVYAHASERMLQDTADRMQGYYDGLGVDKPKRP